MTPKPTLTWRAVLSALLCALALPARGAETEEGPAATVDEATLNKVVELNKKALLAYDSLEMETASALLHQALDLCKTAGLEQHATAARTHLYLGIVYISGLKSPKLGLAEFRQALAIDPKIQITKSLANPEVDAAFERAQSPDAAADSRARVPFPTGQEATVPFAPSPRPGAERISHPLVTRAYQGQPVEIKLQVPPGLDAAKVMLAYMAQDANDFLAREMTPIPDAPGWFHEHIPAAATRGAWVAYYLEVQDAEEQTVAQDGTPEAPHQITLVPEYATEEGPPETSRPAKAPKARSGRGLWVVLAVGSGGGYHQGSPEMNPQDASGARIRESGFGFAELLYLAPEIGYFQRDNLVLSAQGRLQFVTGAQEVRIGQKAYHPAAMAFAGFLKLTWIAARPGRRFQPLVAVVLGAGQIRHTITTPTSARLTGCGRATTCHDTILGGLALVGAGVGFRYHLVEGLGFYAAATLIAGLPDVMLNADVAAGFALLL